MEFISVRDCNMYCSSAYVHCLYFDSLSQKVVPLKLRGEQIPVTEHNKLEYLNLLAQYKLESSVKEEIEHFLSGKELMHVVHGINMYTNAILAQFTFP